LVEDEVDHLEHGRHSVLQILGCGQFEGHRGVRKLLPGSHDSLRNRGCRSEERARDLLSREATEQAKREGDTSLTRQNRVAGDEYEPEDVVAYRVVERCVHI